MDKFDKIFFISMDDTSVGPMAQAICKSLITNEAIEIISKGLVVLFSEPVNPKALDVLRNNKIEEVKDYSEQFDVEELTQKSLILTMTPKERSLLIEDFSVDSKRVHILSEYVEEFSEITDPYGENLPGYERCYFDLVRMIKKLIYKHG